MKRFNPYKRYTGIFIPDGVYKCKDLTPTAKFVYGRLLRFSGKNGVAHPKQEKIAEELSVSISAIKRSIKSLVDIKLIEIEKGNPLKHEPNKYFFLASPLVLDDYSEVSQVNHTEVSRMTLPVDDVVTPLHIEESHKEESHNKREKPSFPYREIFDCYLSFENLKQHRILTEEMKKAIDKFVKATSATVEDIKRVIKRHSRIVDISSSSEYPVRARSIQELFGQKVYQSSHLIGSEYLDDGRYGKDYIPPRKPTRNDLIFSQDI